MQRSTDANEPVSNGNDAESTRIGPNNSGLDDVPFLHNLWDDEDMRFNAGVCEADMKISGSTCNLIEPDNKNDNDNDDLSVQEEDIPPNDIKSGRGRGLQQHPGNILFRNLIGKHFDKYEELGKTDKTKLIKKVYNDITEQNRKFWKMPKGKKGVWKVLDASSALKKIAYTFRAKRKKEKAWDDSKKKTALANRKEKEINPLPPQHPEQLLQMQDAERILKHLG